MRIDKKIHKDYALLVSNNYLVGKENDKFLISISRIKNTQKFYLKTKNSNKTILKAKVLGQGSAQDIYEDLKSYFTINNRFFSYDAFNKFANEKFGDFWIDTSLSPKRSYGQPSSQQSQKGVHAGDNFYKKLRAAPLFRIVEALSISNAISGLDTEANGEETKYKFSLPNGERFNVSLYAENSLDMNSPSETAYVFRDFYRDTSSGGYKNFLRMLVENGISENIDLSNNDVVESEINKLINQKIKPNLIYDGSTEVVNTFNKIGHKPVLISERVKLTGKNDDRFIKYMVEERKIPKSIVDREIASGNISFGNHFTTNNKYKGQQSFFNLKNADGSKGTFQRMFFDRNNKLDKRYLKNVDIKGVAFTNANNPSDSPVDATFFSEAAIDSLSIEAFFTELGSNTENCNFVSAQSVGNMVTLLERDIGLCFSKSAKEESQFGLGYFFDLEKNSFDINEENTRAFVEKIKHSEFTVEDYNTKKKKKIIQSTKKFIYNVQQEDDKRLDIFNAIASKFTDANINYSVHDIIGKEPYIDKKDAETTCILSAINIESFLSKNNMIYDYETKKLSIGNMKDVKRRIDFNNKDHMKEVATRLLKFNSKAVYMAFDHDAAGLKHTTSFMKFFNACGIKAGSYIPPIIERANHGKMINDNNDLIIHLDYLKKQGDSNKINKFVKLFLDSSKLTTDEVDCIYKLRNAEEEIARQNKQGNKPYQKNSFK